MEGDKGHKTKAANLQQATRRVRARSRKDLGVHQVLVGEINKLHKLRCRVAVVHLGKRRCAQPLRDVSTSLGATPAALVAPATPALVRGT